MLEQYCVIFKVALASFSVTWNMFTIAGAVSTNGSDQVKEAGKDYVNVKPV